MNNRHRRLKRLKNEKEMKRLFFRRGARAFHKTGDYKGLGELIDVHSQNKHFYFGNFSQPFGALMVDMKFKKKDCKEVSPKEQKKVFVKFYGEETYKWWFGNRAV